MKHQQYPIPAILTIVLSTLFFIGCSKSGTKPTPKDNGPTITSLSVNTGPYNTSVVITGTEFSSTIANDQAFFNGKAAVLTAATATQLTVTVPLGAGTGNVTVSINNGILVSGPVFNYQLSDVVSTIAGNGTAGGDDGIGTAATFNSPWGIVIDLEGNIYVSDYLDGLIRKITPVGAVLTSAGSVNTAPLFSNAAGVAVDDVADLFIADASSVQEIANGSIVTVKVLYNKGNDITGVAWDDALSYLYAADEANNTIVKIVGGVASIFAGSGTAGKADGQGTSASFNGPVGIAIDQASRSLYVVDERSNLVRKITKDGAVTTIAGSGTAGKADGKGALASFNNPTGIAVDGSGNLYIGDYGNNAIRKITPDGTVSTIAGNGVAGFADGPALNASFNNPQDLVVDASGNIYVADSGNNRIRKISMQ